MAFFESMDQSAASTGHDSNDTSDVDHEEDEDDEDEEDYDHFCHVCWLCCHCYARTACHGRVWWLEGNVTKCHGRWHVATRHLSNCTLEDQCKMIQNQEILL